MSDPVRAAGTRKHLHPFEVGDASMARATSPGVKAEDAKAADDVSGPGRRA